MTELGQLRWLDRIRGEISKAHRELEVERERLLTKRAELDHKVASLAQEMQVLAQLETQSNAPAKETSHERAPLSRRVLEILRSSQAGLTSREIRERLKLGYRESRNLGPVLHQLMKSGRVTSSSRGAPWHLIS